MTSLKTTFLAAALVATPFAFAAPAAQASTVTGSITYAAEAMLTGTVTGSAWVINGRGSFSATGGLSSLSDVAHDWTIEGSIGIPGQGSISGSQTWGAPISAMGLLTESTIPPFSASSVLFTLFSNAMTLSATAIPLGTMGGYAFQGGVLPLGDVLNWEFFPPTATSLAPGEDGIDVTGNFIFTLAGSDIGASLLSLSSFLGIGIGDIPPELGALVLGGLAGDGLPLEVSLTLSPVNKDTVAPIPLPAALPLLAGGLGVLGLMGWRRRRA